MPLGSPSQDMLDAHALMVTLDTCVIQESGYRLGEGALHFLRYQLPKWVRVVLSEIVVRELISHQMVPVSRAHDDIQRSFQVLSRKTELDLKPVQQLYANSGLPASAPETFRKQLSSYLEKFNGQIVPVSGAELSANVIARYFDAVPPFGKAERRKSEFPDAFALLTLESAARSDGKRMIAVSNDGGWKAFATASDTLYSVASLGDLANIFAIEDIRKPAIAQRVVSALNEVDGYLHNLVRSELEKQAPALNWQISTALATGAMTVEKLEVIGLSGSADVERTWTVPDQPNAAMLELELSVEAAFGVLADLAGPDPVLGAEYAAETTTASISAEFSMKMYLELDGDLLNSNPEDWSVQLEFSKELIKVQLGDITGDDLGAALG
jgi:hypothetical protein